MALAPSRAEHCALPPTRRSAARVWRRWLAEFARRHPALEISLRLTEQPIDPPAEAIDIDVRVADFANFADSPPNAQRLVDSHRVVCAAPAYLARRGRPLSPADLAPHDCLALRADDQGFAVWPLHGAAGIETVRVAGPLVTNNADVARGWALAGFGIALLAESEIAADLAAGALVRLLPGYRQPAEVWAVCRCPPADSAKVGQCLRFLRQRLAEDAAS